MKVFHFILDHRFGGPHAYVQSISRMLAGDIESTVVTTAKGSITDIALINLRHKLRALYPIEVALNIIYLCWIFRKKLSRHKTIFDVHGAANIAPVIAARILHIPLVWHFHETVGAFKGLVNIGKIAISGLHHRFVVVSRKSVELFALPDAELIPGAVDTDFWSMEKSNPGGRKDNDPIRIITVGNLNPLKGADLLLEALDGLNTPWELTIVGAKLDTFSGYAKALQLKANKLNEFNGSVEFSGWQPSGVVRDKLANSDIFVLPSRSEACPIALLEAMAIERACVVADVGDVGDIICDSEMGIVVESEDPKRLRLALEKAITLGTKGREEMGVRARDRIVANYTQQVMAGRHLKIYNELILDTREAN